MMTFILVFAVAGITAAFIGVLMEEDNVFYLGCALLVAAIAFSALYLASPACYDGSLTGEAFVKACS